MKYLREKKYEEGWLKDHDKYSSTDFQKSLKIDLKQAQNPNIMKEILDFNQLLF